MNDNSEIKSLVGLFHADWGLAGTVMYLLLLWTGRDHCALCEITHRGLFHNRGWKEFVRRLRVPVELHYRNRLPADIAAIEPQTPSFYARTDGRFVLLLDREALESCEGNVARFEEALYRAAAREELSIPFERPAQKTA